MQSRRGPSGPPFPPPPRRSNIPVRVGPNARYHNPVTSYTPEPSPPPEQPFRYMMVPGLPRGLRPGYYIDPTEENPWARMYSVEDLIEVEQREEEMREELQRNPPPPRLVPGERATGFENLVGTDPENPYGMESWTSPLWDEDPPTDNELDQTEPYGSYLQRDPIIEKDRFYTQTKNNTVYDLLRREWDMDEACRKEPHLHRDRRR